MPTFPFPQSGASLLLSFNPPSSTKPNTLLILAPTRISSVRTFAALEAGYNVLIGASTSHVWEEELAHRHEQGQVGVVEWDLAANAGEQAWAEWFDGLDAEVKKGCMMVVLGDTMPRSATKPGAGERRTFASAQAFAKIANDRRYLVNVADAPTLSDFSFPVTHRFDLGADATTTTLGAAAPPTKSPLQLALTTNSSACRLATRLRREIVASLPSNVGAAVRAVSDLRTALAAEASAGDSWAKSGGGGDEVELAGTGFNRPVEQLTREKSELLERGGHEGQSSSSTSRSLEEGSRGQDSTDSAR